MSKAIGERMVKNFLDLFVLALLNNGSRHGYEIMRELKAGTGTRIGPGTLYPLLYELEERKLVTGEWVSPTRRSRRVYNITEQGIRYRDQGFRGIEKVLKSSPGFDGTLSGLGS
ncbi:helix-turn-helix transcriptional regulator [Candidatus Bathyarchaeota archaeon]|nr:MAG: helix-turn-helix transcriptional regulator [Candidatus Bathyarchaeota archaeon]TMI31513.1 MAG: helix-turn-helix transcriptional regulator [Candidatus Bathyarchaeota archaeon]